MASLELSDERIAVNKDIQSIRKQNKDKWVWIDVVYRDQEITIKSYNTYWQMTKINGEKSDVSTGMYSTVSEYQRAVAELFEYIDEQLGGLK